MEQMTIDAINPAELVEALNSAIGPATTLATSMVADASLAGPIVGGIIGGYAAVVLCFYCCGGNTLY
jgi:hypothetical protein